MRKALLAIGLVAFLVAGAAQPAIAQEKTQQIQEVEQVDNQSTGNETSEVDEEMNETEEEENRSTDRGKSAQFDARLMTAINTLDSLIEIAPTEEARTGLQNALDTLSDVQENTDTASLGPDQTRNESDQRERGPPEQAGPPEARGLGQRPGPQNPERRSETGQRSGSGQPDESGSAGNGGPSNGKKPGFVGSLLNSLFG